MGKYSAPPKAASPEKTAAAQADVNTQTAVTQAMLNMTNQQGPYGTITYTPTAGSALDSEGRPLQWTQTTTLSPEQQYLLDLEESGMARFGETGNQMMAQLQGTLQTPLNFEKSIGGILDWSRDAGLGPDAINFGQQVGDLQKWSEAAGYSQGREAINDSARDEMENALFSRLNPQIEQDRARMETRLANQGITAGSEAYNAEMKRLEDQIANQRLDIAVRGGEEARAQAALGSSLDATKRGQIMDVRGQYASELAQQQADAENIARYRRGQILGVRDILSNEMLQQRDLPLNELISLMNGVQVSTPQMNNTPQTGVGQTDFMGAQQAADQQNYAGWQSRQQAAQATTGAAATAAATIAAAAIAA